jgi:acetyl-CoA carboxylase biotin carboxyl carrier protein
MLEEEDRREAERRTSLPMEDVERLVDLVRESGVGEIRVRQGELEIEVRARPSHRRS